MKYYIYKYLYVNDFLSESMIRIFLGKLYVPVELEQLEIDYSRLMQH